MTPPAYVNHGNALRAEGQLDEAIAAYRQAIAFNPNYAEARGNLGIALKDKGQLDEATQRTCRGRHAPPTPTRALEATWVELTGAPGRWRPARQPP